MTEQEKFANEMMMACDLTVPFETRTDVTMRLLYFSRADARSVVCDRQHRPD
jgi:hypothetical protein